MQRRWEKTGALGSKGFIYRLCLLFHVEQCRWEILLFVSRKGQDDGWKANFSDKLSVRWGVSTAAWGQDMGEGG